MKKLIIVLILIMVFSVTSLTVSANGVPYATFTYSSSQGRIVPTQDAYLPLSMSYNLGGETLLIKKITCILQIQAINA